jgi:hypothetical protein
MWHAGVTGNVNLFSVEIIDRMRPLRRNRNKGEDCNKMGLLGK